MTTRYVALLRGINVGGNNIIRMVDLKACFESMGFDRVVTYIQSGNVLFDSSENDMEKLTNAIENSLSDRFAYNARVVLITQKMVQRVVAQAPNGFGTEPEAYRYDVFFLKEPMTTTVAKESIKTRDGVDFVWFENGVVYFSRLISKAGQSYMNGIIKTPLYKYLTIRNWNTTSRLTEL